MSNTQQAREQPQPQTNMNVRLKYYNYDSGSFVVVNATENSNNLFAFWIGKVNEIVTHGTGRIEKIEVHLFEPSNLADAINSRYFPSFVNYKKTKLRVE